MVEGVSNSLAGTLGGMSAGRVGAMADTPGDKGLLRKASTKSADNGGCCGCVPFSTCTWAGACPRTWAAMVLVISGGSLALGYSKLLYSCCIEGINKRRTEPPVLVPWWVTDALRDAVLVEAVVRLLPPSPRTASFQLLLLLLLDNLYMRSDSNTS